MCPPHHCLAGMQWWMWPRDVCRGCRMAEGWGEASGPALPTTTTWLFYRRHLVGPYRVAYGMKCSICDKKRPQKENVAIKKEEKWRGG